MKNFLLCNFSPGAHYLVALRRMAPFDPNDATSGSHRCDNRRAPSPMSFLLSDFLSDPKPASPVGPGMSSVSSVPPSDSTPAQHSAGGNRNIVTVGLHDACRLPALC